MDDAAFRTVPCAGEPFVHDPRETGIERPRRAVGASVISVRPLIDPGYGEAARLWSGSETPVTRRRRQAQFMTNARFPEPEGSSGRPSLLARGTLAIAAIAIVALVLGEFLPL